MFCVAKRRFAPSIPAVLRFSRRISNGFRAALTLENRTLKRALTDPRLISGVGNAYSDEILHAAQLSPITLTHKLKPEEWERLFAATRSTLTLVDRSASRLRREKSFPEKVTAFRPEMAVHGRFGLPCPRCGEKVQRIRYADNETNYCARCQTGGKVLADRSLSRLLGSDWPRTLEELEALNVADLADVGAAARPSRPGVLGDLTLQPAFARLKDAADLAEKAGFVSRAEVAELADARGSGPRTRKGVGVRVPSSAPKKISHLTARSCSRNWPVASPTGQAFSTPIRAS